MEPTATTQLAQRISELLTEARGRIVQSVNHTMVLTYYEIGRMIVHEEQNGNERADYGKQLIKTLSIKLTADFGKGFSQRNLEQMRQFYLVYSKAQTLSAESEEDNKPVRKFQLSWSHYLKLMRIEDVYERNFYEIESYKNNWSLRELERQYNTALYTRLSLSRNGSQVRRLAKEGQLLQKPQDAIKDPYILEFIGLPEQSTYSESELEQKLIEKLEHFMLELGTGFTFVARQQRISFDEKHFRIDLVFYNRILRCFVLIDLKIGELKHQDIGQMQMYVNFYDRRMRLPEENKTIGIILCQDKSEAVVEFTLPENNQQIFASKYTTVLPSKESLAQIIISKS
ncbi:PDDEXK nuclease domain-containing protein [Flavobacterium sp. MFBS3-15]|uniref:PDDEXK nuclease domain-containing protein n=1 Tax=Flavobacterium sp. MFBS3-15 TaxID=2989816 RepID=UPI002236AF7B|nr:PDDEXK nuclease domain-containing protein [Flavobacterium sp. MFBS3-15]MCW4470247.1 PDDEXK nuclease domain-containing protein [Flavobacterium sp. MFBS3-15]